MRLILPPEMKKLLSMIKPYLDKNFQLPEDAPEEIKKASKKYLEWVKEQERLAYDL